MNELMKHSKRHCHSRSLHYFLPVSAQVSGTRKVSESEVTPIDSVSEIFKTGC